ncbi:lipase family protein [Pendulispora rubella]|uniref:Lipase family protein n=1 Tax=Pendulispora rubella TaxID=2741070 RepID=A0ABZ2KUZ4_9BACT
MKTLQHCTAVMTMLLASLSMEGVAAAATPPSQDAFYTAPAAMPSVPSGTILASRPVTLALPLAVKAWQLKYATTDEHDRPVVAIATLVVPILPYLGTRPLLSYNVAIDSLSIDCNPSYVMQGGVVTPSTSANFGTALEMANVVLALKTGWAVVVPDHEGLAMNFTVGPMSGHAVLDGIRAARSYTEARLRDAPLTMWGYSGGAQATMWAAELAPSYAPELRFKGIAAGGVPVDLVSILRYVGGTYMSGIAAGGVMGQADAYPEYNAHRFLNDAGRKLRADVRRQCIGDLIMNYAFKDLSDYSTVPDMASEPDVQAIAAHSRLGGRKPAGPLYVYHGYWDQAIPYRDVEGLVDGYCKQGVSVTFNIDQLNHVTDHFAYAALGVPGAFVYLQAAVAGFAAPSTCR